MSALQQHSKDATQGKTQVKKSQSHSIYTKCTVIIFITIKDTDTIHTYASHCLCEVLNWAEGNIALKAKWMQHHS